MSNSIKCIILVLLTIFSLLMSVASFVMMTEGEIYGQAMLVLFLLVTAINIGEINRIRKGKKYIFLPMIGMYLVAAMSALLFQFIREVVSGDHEAIGAMITIAICETITILSMYGFHKGMSMKAIPKENVSENASSWKFSSFNAEWSWDDTWDEYRNILLDRMSEEERSTIDDVESYFDQYLEKHPEAIDEINIYSCNEFAYLFLWLLRRNGINEKEFVSALGGEMTESFRALADGEENPAEFIYYQLDGKVSRNDILPIYSEFLDNYYESLFFNPSTNKRELREVFYSKDYGEIVLQSLEGTDGPIYCRDFNYEKYDSMEKRIDQRFDEFMKTRPLPGTVLLGSGVSL